MPVTESKVRELLAPLEQIRPITSRKMFGGIGIYCDGIFFSVIDDDRLFFKVDGQTEPDYAEFDSPQWMIEGNPPSPMPYRQVPSKILEDPVILAIWIDRAVDVAIRKKKPSKKR